jgi:hypothetical protein
MKVKRWITAAAIIAALALVLWAGYRAGIRHAMTESKVYLDEDLILIELDGNLYEF